MKYVSPLDHQAFRQHKLNEQRTAIPRRWFHKDCAECSSSGIYKYAKPTETWFFMCPVCYGTGYVKMTPTERVKCLFCRLKASLKAWWRK